MLGMLRHLKYVQCAWSPLAKATRLGAMHGQHEVALMGAPWRAREVLKEESMLVSRCSRQPKERCAPCCLNMQKTDA